MITYLDALMQFLTFLVGPFMVTAYSTVALIVAFGLAMGATLNNSRLYGLYWIPVAILTTNVFIVFTVAIQFQGDAWIPRVIH